MYILVILILLEVKLTLWYALAKPFEIPIDVTERPILNHLALDFLNQLLVLVQDTILFKGKYDKLHI